MVTSTTSDDLRTIRDDTGDGRSVVFAVEPMSSRCDLLVVTRSDVKSGMVLAMTRTLRRQEDGSLMGETNVAFYSEAEGPEAAICTATFDSKATR